MKNEGNSGGTRRKVLDVVKFLRHLAGEGNFALFEDSEVEELLGLLHGERERRKGEIRHSYPALIIPCHNDEDYWMITFPDFGEGAFRIDASMSAEKEAKELLRECLDRFEREGREIPSPTPLEDLVAEEGSIIRLITVSSGK